MTSAGKTRYYEESDKKIQTNKDGSKTIPKGFVMNRVGKASKDVNKSGALYMSYGKDDAARYVKSLGPTPLGKLFGTAGEAVQHISAKSDVNKSGALYMSYGKDDAARYVKSLGPTPLGKLFGTAGEAVQHISAKSNLRMPSDKDVAIETAKLLRSDKKLFNSFKDSFYSYAVSTDDITEDTIRKALADPEGRSGQKLAYGISTFLGDPNYADESKIVYDHFRQKGYDVIPDLHDRLSGTSNTAMIVINPDKVEVTSYTTITKDVYRAGRDYVKSLGKLPISDLIKD